MVVPNVPGRHDIGRDAAIFEVRLEAVKVCIHISRLPPGISEDARVEPRQLAVGRHEGDGSGLHASAERKHAKRAGVRGDGGGHRPASVR